MPTVSEVTAVSQAMKGIAGAVHDELKELTGHPMGFALVVFTHGQCQYISNCDRKKVVIALQTLLAMWSEGMPDVSAHEVH